MTLTESEITAILREKRLAGKRASYAKHRDAALAYKRSPEHRARANKAQRERYAASPDYRAGQLDRKRRMRAMAREAREGA